MTSFRVVVTDQVFPSVSEEEALVAGAGGELIVADGGRDEVLELVSEADAVLNTYFQFTADDVPLLTRCKIIARYGIGVDNLPLDALRDAGIAVTNVPDYCVEEVAAHTTALILALTRKVVVGNELVRAGGWGISGLGSVDRLSEQVAGLVGYGRISQQVAGSLQQLGMRVVVSDPYVSSSSCPYELVGFDELLASADVISIHCPLTPETRGLISERALKKVKPNAILVNTARGAIVETSAVIAALRAGELGGAGLDVFDAEPPEPSIFEGTPNLIATPHAAFYSRQAIVESQRKAASQVIKAVTDQPLDYRVN